MPLWLDVHAAKRKGETDTATVCRLLETSLRQPTAAEEVSTTTTTALLAQLDRKDAQIDALTRALEQRTQEHEARLEALLAATESTAKATQALIKERNAPRTIEAKVYDEEGHPVGTKPRRTFGQRLKEWLR